MTMPESPYATPVISSPKDSQRSGLKVLLAIGWFFSILAIPTTMIYEESVVENQDRNFRLGLLHLFGPIVALVLPLFYGASIRSKLSCLGLSAIAVFVMFVVTAVACVMLFGITAT